MAFIRSVLHLLWMSVTVIPYSLAMLVVRLFGGSQDTVYRIARAWLALSVHSARPLMGISYRVTGMENLPTDDRGQFPAISSIWPRWISARGSEGSRPAIATPLI